MAEMTGLGWLLTSAICGDGNFIHTVASNTSACSVDFATLWTHRSIPLVITWPTAAPGMLVTCWPPFTRHPERCAQSHWLAICGTPWDEPGQRGNSLTRYWKPRAEVQLPVTIHPPQRHCAVHVDSHAAASDLNRCRLRAVARGLRNIRGRKAETGDSASVTNAKCSGRRGFCLGESRFLGGADHRAL